MANQVENKKLIILTSTFIAVLSTILMFLYRSEKFTFNDENIESFNEEGLEIIKEISCKRLRVWTVFFEDFSSYAPSLRSHNRVFTRLDYKFVNASHGDDWDILWSTRHPLDKRDSLNPLFNDFINKKPLPHQKVNHIPGVDALISKPIMNEVNRGFDFNLPSFVLPDDQEEFVEFIKVNPQKMLLKKNFYNRGVEIIEIEDIEESDEEIFYQEFMDNPFLIDGHAFDFGVFVLITSFDPLRVYRYSEEVLLRFCREKYFPFDPDDDDKYVVQEGSLHVTEMPSLKELYKNFSLSSKIMFENLIKNQGFNVREFWNRIDSAISQIAINAEEMMIEGSENLNLSNHNFFELVRFDIILDAKLNPYVVEVNMSPNLTPASEKYEENSLIYEQLIYNVIKMIGGGSHHEFWSRFDSTDTIVKNRKNLATSLTECLQNDCQNSCNKTICEICHPCMTPEVYYQLSETFREHQNSANFNRVFPAKKHFSDDKFIEEMTKNNQIQIIWFKGKCEEDERWC